MLFMQRKRMLKGQWSIAFCTFLACGVLIWAVLAGQSGVGMQLSSEMVLGIIASIICGVGAVLCRVYFKQLNEIGWMSSMILAKRFIGTVIISFIITFDLVIPYFKDNIVWILLVTVVGVMIQCICCKRASLYKPIFSNDVSFLCARISIRNSTTRCTHSMFSTYVRGCCFIIHMRDVEYFY